MAGGKTEFPCRSVVDQFNAGKPAVARTALTAVKRSVKCWAFTMVDCVTIGSSAKIKVVAKSTLL